MTTKKNPALENARTLTAQARETGRQSSILMAQAWNAAEPFIGSDDAPEWATGADYARSLGVAKSSLTRIKRMGRALALGINPDDTEKGDAHVWSLISDLATDATVGTAIMDEKATATKIRTAVKRRKAEKEREAKQGRTPTQRTEKDTEKGPEMPRNNSGLLDLLETVAARFDRSHVTPAEYERLAAVVESLGEISATVKKADAKNGKTVAKKAA